MIGGLILLLIGYLIYKYSTSTEALEDGKLKTWINLGDRGEANIQLNKAGDDKFANNYDNNTL